ncbi:MAG: MarR family transcriptional regulator [Paludibacterium sp.]|uniref:MarR family winged helix-turn-helix transcriptional regulator n=1 Tax=Paludibacterium sp. TaxID=1917523 RepID=UPI0025FCD5E9|nr:MarR family transcriptional regulator [Paludibacterium sp.]MBV8046154.1 MarR family transcriptional regulator [Paludibacterium sp.]
MAEDIVKALGYMTLGSRMKRLGESLQAQTQDVLAQAGIDIPASLCPALAALARSGPLSVGALALALGVSQPAVTRMLEKLETSGWVGTCAEVDDRRVRAVMLTPQGRAIVEQAKAHAWRQVASVVAAICVPLSGSLLEQLAALEDALAERTLSRRAGYAAIGGGDEGTGPAGME